MGYHIFDNPSSGLLMALVVQAGLLIGWLINREKIRSVYLILGPVLAGLVLLMDFLVDTSREQLDDRTRELVAAAEAEQADVLISALAPVEDFDGHTVPSVVKAAIERYLSGPLLDTCHISDLEVSQYGPTAGNVRFKVIVTMDQESRYAYVPVFASVWEISYVREDERNPYLIEDVQLLMFNGEKPDFDIWRVRGR